MGYVTPPSVPTKILSELGGRQAVVIVFGLERKGRWRESEQRMKNIREERERERERVEREREGENWEKDITICQHFNLRVKH